MTVKMNSRNDLITKSMLQKIFRDTLAEEYALNACKLAGCECTGSAAVEPDTQAATEASPVSNTEAHGAICDAAKFAYDNVKYDSSERDFRA